MLGHSVPLGTQVRQHKNPCPALTTGTERAGVFMLQHPGRLHSSQGAANARYSQLLIWLHVQGVEERAPQQPPLENERDIN